MSKTKTKRMVASFLLLCAMSGTSAFADPLNWKPGDYLTNYIDSKDEVVFDTRNEFSGLTGSTTSNIAIPYGNDTAISVIFKGEDKTFKFYNNVTPDSGAAMYLFGDKASVTIEGISEFVNNRAEKGYGPYNGGAIYSHLASINFLKKAVFRGNIANDGNGRGLGGAISSNGVTNFNGGVDFINNNSATLGGAVFVGKDGKLNIFGGEVLFRGNTSGDKGGAIYSEGQISLDSNGGAITFDGNKANNQNNDVYLAAGSLALQGSNNITFNGSILGEAATTITNEAANLVLKGDNSDYQGTFTQASGKTTVKGKFFGGSNIHQINGGELILAAAKAIDGSKIAVNNDANINVDVDTTMNGNISGNGNITLDKNVTLTLLNDQSVFNGTYSQSSGNLVIGDGTVETKSFSGNNNISGGKVTVKNKATLSGTNVAVC